MARRMRGNSHVRCKAGEKAEIISNPYLSLFFAQDPEEVAEVFMSLLTTKYKNCFEEVRFAIIDKNGNNYKAFEKVLK